MTQRVDLATVMDRLAIDALVTGYAVALDDGDWEALAGLFTATGRADHRTAGGIEGGVEEMVAWLAGTMARYSVRQHLYVNRQVTVEQVDGGPGDTARVRADYLRPLRPSPDAGPVSLSGGRCLFIVARTPAGWRIDRLTVQEKWRQAHAGPYRNGPGL
ncbi:nuclear transport factor 2 family protein [Streptomyces sp. NPDC060194]|uniref:nuclear transport factor 2 family protein n=1 Tax=Streptomyces sp. NPDC060194 TaxID=3347069 RepID=UPI0036613C99